MDLFTSLASPLTYSLIAALLVACMSLGGVLLASTRGTAFITRYHHHVLAFAIGVLLMILYSLGEEGLHLFEETPHFFVLGALGGAGLLVLVSRLHRHHHHTTEHEHGTHAHTHSRIDGSRVLVADGVHNISDGLILYPAFLISPITGLIATVGVAIHEFISEVSEFFILKEAGYSTREALVRNFFTACSIFIGVFVAYLFASLESFEGWILAVSFGAFAYLIFVDLVPCVYTHAEKKRQPQYVLATLLGLTIMLGISFAFPHEHETHEDDHTDETTSEHAAH